MDPNELDHLIDELVAGRHASDEAEADDVAAALQRVRAMAAEPLPAASRSRHLAAIRTAGTTTSPSPAPARRMRPGWLPRFRHALVPVTAVVTALVLVGGGGTVALAQDAGPDDTLYPVKRGTERLWLALPRGAERAAEAHLAIAERRVEEAELAPEHADDLLADGVSNVEEAAEEKPEEALATFARLLGTGEDALPAHASPRARSALYRNCLRIAAKHGLDHACPEPADLGEHPGRGRGAGPGGPGSGPAGEPPGWGPGGRPDGAVGPPPGAPGQQRRTPGEGAPQGEGAPAGEGEKPGRGWGPGGRPEGQVGPPPGTPGHGGANPGDPEIADS